MKSKTCFKCNTEKPLSDFYKHSRMKDGRVNKCKECNKKDVQANYRKNIIHYKLYDLDRNQLRKEYLKDKNEKYLENHPGAPLLANSKWRNANKHKYKAHTIVNTSIRGGLIIKRPCEVCGNIKVEAHHRDYSKPLEVVWLCAKHHREEHVRNRRAELVTELSILKGEEVEN